MADPYGAVRFTAHHSLRQYAGFGRFEFDFLGSQQERAAAMGRAVRTWREPIATPADWAKPAILLDSDANMEVEQVQALLRQRDDRPLTLPE
jgi:hypothetical protein